MYAKVSAGVWEGVHVKFTPPYLHTFTPPHLYTYCVMQVTPEDYVKAVSALQPDLYVTMCDEVRRRSRKRRRGMGGIKKEMMRMRMMVVMVVMMMVKRWSVTDISVSNVSTTCIPTARSFQLPSQSRSPQALTGLLSGCNAA